ncbi:MAG: ROK family protein [Rhizobiales bacterium]|nr:ROK family protein [Hyphomicrobiales bacterium]
MSFGPDAGATVPALTAGVAGLSIGVDLGGTKIEAMALDASGEAVFRQRTATPRGYDAVLRAIAGLVAAAESATGLAGTIGVGAPGSLSPASGLWRNANIEFCNGRDLPGDLAAALGRPVRVENDGNCFALSEAIDGAGADSWTVYGLTAGTGLGGGMVIGQRLNRGRNAAAAEAGHVPLPWLQPEDFPLPPCYCGLEGCAEQYISGTGLARDFRAVTGTALTGEEIIALAAAGDAPAAAAVERLHDRFARYLSVLVNIMDPDVIVLGGGLSKVPGFCGNVAWRVPRTTFARDIEVRFVPAVHGDSSGVRGAARLWDGA